MPLSYIAEQIWRWFAETGINLALLLTLAFLVPRAGRFLNRHAERQVKESGETDEAKSRLAIVGVGVYIAQMIAYFLIFVFALQQLGFSLAGAAIPATVVSAAIGFGAQNIIADFLAGFFILTEKQFGVGDYVAFQGNGIDVSGEVIQITMRATQIRTLEQSTISIPNSTARICINQSNYWASAVVVIPVPLLGSASAEDALQRTQTAAQRALSQPEIADATIDDVVVQPAVAVNPPATVGSSWTVDMRVMVRTEPLMQWMVERAIRMSILDEFWNEYGAATTFEGALVQSLEQPTRHFNTQPSTEQIPNTPPPTQALPATNPIPDPAADDATAADEDAPEPRRVFRGIMRLSTAFLLAGFAVLLIVRGLMLQPAEESNANSGVLAPPARPTFTSNTPLPASQVESPTLDTSTVEPTLTETTEPTTPAPTTTSSETSEWTSETTTHERPEPTATPTAPEETVTDEAGVDKEQLPQQ
ncbi:mechanosensitive ion channel family protein [Corynebacterium sp. NML130628]|uniref:mechanosensitive ion channel family protein n=1 Tax=Corynebacterium sp. NML130628 TaxID=1906333 RepID=UPI0008FB3F6C|nr:mechanosensitive ion channel domain-containing protein [Corynebacterium sp. NML130628]OIR41294.1 small-conductance mechanosensitive channel [Corynebacterium sp. NML130628]